MKISRPAPRRESARSAPPEDHRMMTPIGIGCSVVAISRKRCSTPGVYDAGRDQKAISPPETIVTIGTAMMSTLVLPAMSEPSSAPTTAAK